MQTNSPSMQKLIAKIDDLWWFNISWNTTGVNYDFGQYKLNKIYKPLIKYYIQEYAAMLDRLPHDSDRDQIIWLFSDFFSLYFSNGDFGYFKNRFSSYEYRIPYSGKDTEFRWATKDCYYVKTSDIVNDMQVDLGSLFGSRQWTLKLFKKTKVDTDSSGNDVYRFDVQIEDIVEEETNELLWYSVIFYNYEEDKNLKSKQKDERIAEVLLSKWIQAKDPSIAKTLSDFLAKRGRDYFIHKRLKAFLSEELEWYFFQLLKNDIQGKVDILTLQNKIAEIKVKYQDDQEVIDMKVAKLMSESSSPSISNYQIAYLWILNFINILADLEEFKAKLWNKERKVIKQEYCISLSKIPVEYHAEVLANTSQQQERKELGMTAGSQGLFTDDLSLVVDTKHYSGAIRERLVTLAQSSEITGRLIKSDNYQALQWMQKEYTDQIKCVYIDPPYNTWKDGFIYKDKYSSSSRASMMYDRLWVAKKLMHDSALLEVSTDGHELVNLQKILSLWFWEENEINLASVINNMSWRSDDTFLATSHESLSIYSKKKESVDFVGLKRDDISKYKYEDKISKYSIDWSPFRKTWKNSLRKNRPNLFYPVYVSPNHNELSLDKIEWRIEILPIDSDWKERTRTRERKTFLEKKDTEIHIHKKLDWEIVLYKKSRITDYEKPKTCLYKPEYSTSTATKMFGSMFPDIDLSEWTPKSIYYIMDIIWFSDPNIILDFFAWSWTTWHAVLRLNKDWGERKFILVELGKYFDDVTLKRIKKVMYSEKREEGVAVDNNWTQSVIQYLHLNQYEDWFADNGYLRQLEWEINMLSQIEISEDMDIKHILHPLRELLHKVYTLDDQL
jgi:adenine-specific DNA-methyltransferase